MTGIFCENLSLIRDSRQRPSTAILRMRILKQLPCLCFPYIHLCIYVCLHVSACVYVCSQLSVPQPRNWCEICSGLCGNVNIAASVVMITFLMMSIPMFCFFLHFYYVGHFRIFDRSLMVARACCTCYANECQ